MHRWQYRSIVIRFAVVASQICEITRNSEKIQTYSSSRSSKVIDLAANQKHICNFLLLINSNIGLSRTVSEILTQKARKSPFSLTVGYCDCRPLAEERPAIYQRNLCIADSTGLSIVWWKLQDPNFNHFCMNHPCDGTDRRNCDSICALSRLQHMLSHAIHQQSV